MPSIVITYAAGPVASAEAAALAQRAAEAAAIAAVRACAAGDMDTAYAIADGRSLLGRFIVRADTATQRARRWKAAALRWRRTALHLAPAPVALAQHLADAREAALFGEVAK